MSGLRRRAGFVVVAVASCALLVAGCLAHFTAHAARPSPSAENGLAPTVRIVEHIQPSLRRAVYVSMPETRLAVPAQPPVSGRRAQALHSHNQLASIAAEEGQLRRIEADVVARTQMAAVPAAAPVAPPPHLMSQSQLDAAVQKLSSGKAAVAKGLASALERMNKLREEEHDLHKELGAVLGKISSMQIVTSETIAVPDGMGGDQMEVVVARPLGGKASATVIRTDGNALIAAKNAASSGEGYLGGGSPPFPPHDSGAGNDGLGGSQSPLAPDTKVLPLLPDKVGKGLAPKVRGDHKLFPLLNVKPHEPNH